MAFPFPVVPIAPGVPLLPRNPLEAIVGVALLTADVLFGVNLNFGPRWGIFLDGIPVVAANSVAAFEYRQDWVVSDYPQEQGAFESYDKVQIPFLARVRFTSGGSEGERVALLQSIASIAGDLELYDVVTPEVVYTSCNISHYDYRRSAVNGVGMIIVDVWLVQVRVTAFTEFSNTASPSGAGTFSNGGVQTQPVSSEQNQAIVDGAQ